jgi:hypothetical protein
MTDEVRPFPIASFRDRIDAALTALPAGTAAFVATTEGPTVYDAKRTAAVSVMVKTPSGRWSFGGWMWTHSDRPVADLAAGFEIRRTF